MPPSPEFVMPPDAPASPPAVLPARDDQRSADQHTAEPDEPIVRPRLPWRQLTAGVLVGILLGAGVPSAFQGVDQAAADARTERLRSTAMDYLQLIAAGDSNGATAMVPVEGETPPDTVLRSAERIELADVQLITIDGDHATVEVRYRVAGRRVARSLDAEHADGQWRLLTSLTEPIMAFSYDGLRGVSVAGVELPPDGRAQLYPGSYRSDRTTTPLITTGGERFHVDGDPETPTEVYSPLELAAGVDGIARDVAIAHVRACGGGGCPIEVGADVSTLDGPWVQGVDTSTGAVDLVLQLHSGEFAGTIQELRMRAVVDEAGSIILWECSELGQFGSDLEPCRA